MADPPAPSIWERLAAEGGHAPPGPPAGLWERLKERLNPALYRPAGAPEAEAVPLATRRGDPYYILANRRQDTYARLDPQDHHLWILMDGTRSVKDLVIEYFTRFGALAFDRVAQLVVHLRTSRMLRDLPRNVPLVLRRALAGRGLGLLPLRAWQVVSGQRKLIIRGVDGVIDRIYRSGGWLLYTLPAQILYVVTCAVGAWLFIEQAASGRYALFQAGGSYARGLLVMYGLFYGTVAIHELAHALTCKHYGARVNSVGAMLYFGMPAYYVDTTDIWTRPTRARIATSWAGPYSGFILAGVASILVALWPDAPVAGVLHRLAFVMLLILVFNLIPLLELDGYFILIDWLETPMLRARSLAFIRGDLWRKVRRREPFTAQERLLGAFGLLSLAFSAFAVVLALQFWQRRLGLVARELWAGGLVSKGLLALLFLMLLLPLVVGAASRAVQAGRTATTWVRTPWRQPRRWTLRDREALLREVRFLAPLGPDQLAAVTTRAGRATFRPGEVVVRLGDPGDRFFIIESGSAEVLTADGTVRRTLGRGDYFGEVALLYQVRRTATVWAATPLGVLWLRKGDFERLLAPHVEAWAGVDEAIRVLDELRAFPMFADLPSRDLDELAARLERVAVPAGAFVVQEGEMGDAFYLIVSGQAEVTGQGRRIRTLGRGDYFGEIALIQRVPRTATVRALTPLEVLRLSATDFDMLIGTTLQRLAGGSADAGREVVTDIRHYRSPDESEV